ncbi:MAG: RNA polymerase sigma factor [Clostridia bacterium]|nr:RNA polymerase sigma factor [Clostridia bacterium]
MEDKRIIELYFARDERAIEETKSKYGRLLLSIAYRILGNRQDSEECESDTYFRTWNSVPPTNPSSLSAYLSRITRNLAINRYHRNRRSRDGEMELILDELSEVITDDGGRIDEQIALQDALEGFVGGLDMTKRLIFLKRYYYMMSLRDIARDMEISVGTVKSHLSRMRNALRNYLTERGIVI